MRSLRVNFFATAADLQQGLGLVESAIGIKYLLMQNSVSERVVAYNGLAEIPGLGLAVNDASVACDQYLVMKADACLELRKIIGVDGWPRYLVDQLLNPGSVTLNAGGLRGQDVLLQGRVASTHGDPTAREIFGAIRSGIRRNFEKVGASWVGVDAMRLWGSGVRLTMDVAASSGFDLKR